MTIAYILAGGYGKRLKKVVPNLPKPMALIEKKPFLEYLLDYWIDEGISKFIISVGYLKNIIIYCVETPKSLACSGPKLAKRRFNRRFGGRYRYRQSTGLS